MSKVYFISDGSDIKIGYTTQAVEARLKQLNTGNQKNLYILGWITGTADDEYALHIKFGKYRIRSNGEWFQGAEEIIDFINEVNEKPHTYICKDKELLGDSIMVLATT